MRLKLCILWCCIVFLSSVVFAEENGGFSGAFLRVGLGARALAMGNAQVATADNGYGFFYNPAALPLLEKKEFSLSYSSMSLDRKFNFIGFALPLPPFAGASVGWINSGVGNLRAYDSGGQDVGEMDHGLNAIYASFAIKMIALAQADKQLENVPADFISLALSVKFLRENVDDNEQFDYKGSGFGLDFGLLLKPHRNLAIGYQVKDVNASLKSNTNDLFERGSDLDNKFPLTQKAGLFYRTPLKWASVAYDFEWSNKGAKKHHAGLELTSKIAVGRLGYDTDHFTAGGGLKFQAFKKTYMALDYAYVESVIDEGASHVFSWQFLF
jgi:hypothetical protein